MSAPSLSLSLRGLRVYAMELPARGVRMAYIQGILGDGVELPEMEDDRCRAAVTVHVTAAEPLPEDTVRTLDDFRADTLESRIDDAECRAEDAESAAADAKEKKKDAEDRPHPALVGLLEAVRRAGGPRDALELMSEALFGARLEGEDDRHCRQIAVELGRFAFELEG